MAGRTASPAPATPVPTAIKTIALKDRTVQAAVRELRKIRDDEAGLQERRKELERRVKAAMGDAEEATVAGVKVATYRVVLRQSLSATLVKKAYPEVAAECTVQSEVRPFRLLDV
jgi:predicted phage-related endonuclease